MAFDVELRGVCLFNKSYEALGSASVAERRTARISASFALSADECLQIWSMPALVYRVRLY